MKRFKNQLKLKKQLRMKKLIYILFFPLAALLMVSCEDFLDVNSDPENLTDDKIDVSLRLASVVEQTNDAYGSMAFRISNISQELYRYNSARNGTRMPYWNPVISDFTWPWQVIFVNVGSSNRTMIKMALEEGSYHYAGAGMIMEAYGMDFLMAVHGDLIYEEAFQPQIIMPKFDDPEQLYYTLIDRVDEGIAQLQKEQAGGVSSLSAGDYLFDGDVDLWIKFGYGVKARLLQKITKKAIYDAAAVIDCVNKSFESVEESPRVDFPGGDNTNLNSLYGPRQMGSRWVFGDHYVSYFTHEYPGAPSPQPALDPRAEFLLAPNINGEYKGLDFHAELPNYLGYRDSLECHLAGTYYFGNEKSNELLSYEELQFIKAEALFLQNKKGEALTTMQNVIEANMRKLGVAEADITEYLSSNALPQSADEVTLMNIMTQKFIALPLGSPERWVDLRRYDYSTDVFPAYQKPTAAEVPVWYGERYMRRAPTHTYELQYNEANAIAIGAAEQDYLTKHCWWDEP